MKLIIIQSIVRNVALVVLPLMFVGCERSARAPVEAKEPIGTIGRALPGQEGEARDRRSDTERNSENSTRRGSTTVDDVFADIEGPSERDSPTDGATSIDGTRPEGQRSREVATSGGGNGGLEIRLTDGTTTTINWDGLSDRSSDSKLKVQDVY